MYSSQVPQTLRESLLSPKHHGKRSSKGKGRKSDTPSRTAEPPAGLEQNYKVPHNIKRMSCCVFVLLVVMSSPCFLSLFPNSDLHPQDSGLDQLTQGLASLDIHQATSANQMPVSPEVGGARRKVVPQKSLSQEEVKPSPQVVTAEDSQLAASKVEDSQSEAAVGVAGAEPEEEGACGWSKPPANLELISCGDGGGVSTTTRLPQQTRMYQTLPDYTRPCQTLPDQTRPNQTLPDQTRPYQTKPDQTRPYSFNLV